MIGLLIVISGWHGIAGAARLKDIAEINGVRMNQLVGYGLVVGLDGSGDGKKATLPSNPWPPCWKKWVSLSTRTIFR
jgi:flagellar basal body P-ring protein FlgI